MIYYKENYEPAGMLNIKKTANHTKSALEIYV